MIYRSCFCINGDGLETIVKNSISFDVIRVYTWIKRKSCGVLSCYHVKMSYVKKKIALDVNPKLRYCDAVLKHNFKKKKMEEKLVYELLNLM